MEYEEFIKYCSKGYCLRDTIFNEKTCAKDLKRKRCFEKLLAKKIKSERKIDENTSMGVVATRDDYLGVKDAVWKRDAGGYDGTSKKENWKQFCRFWKCLTEQEQQVFLEVHEKELWLCKTLDVAHVKGKGSNPGLKFEIENVVLINRLVHSLLDTYYDPLDKSPIDKEKRNYWFQRILK